MRTSSSDPSRPSTPTPSRRRAVALVIVGLAVLLVLTGASTSSPWSVAYSDFGGLMPPPAQPTAPPEVTSSGGSRLLTQVFVAVVVVLVLLVAWRLWQLVLRPTLGTRDSARSAAPTAPTASEASVTALRQGVVGAERLLWEVTDPTEAVTRAWLALEDAAARSGHPRDAAATPSEFTADVLRTTPADDAAVRQLLALYHRARFSRPGLRTADRDSARACLAALAESWSRFDTALVHVAPDPPEARS